MRAWVTGARPKTLFAAIGPVATGGGLALADGRFVLLPFLAALAGALSIQIGTNLANDYSDYRRGADSGERLGSIRVTQAGLLPPRSVRRGAAVCFGAAVLLGIYLIRVGGWPILGLGLASIVAGITYTGGPWPFGYHGLGDLFAFLFFGPFAVGGTYYVQALTLSPDPLLAGSGSGALVTAILVVNNLRDIETDRRSGKRTLAVRLGARRTRLEYAALLLIGALVPLVGWQASGWSGGGLLAWGAFLLAPAALRTVFRPGDPRSLNPVLGRTALLSALYGVLFAVGVNL
ncbi:MAG: 1,4-dihydroxy-2-naphthoate polyprenyltransferase [Gemmatimonadota bacterium]